MINFENDNFIALKRRTPTLCATILPATSYGEYCNFRLAILIPASHFRTNDQQRHANCKYCFSVLHLFFVICCFQIYKLPTALSSRLPLNALICSPVRADKKKRICNLLAFLQLPFQLHECYILVQCCIASVVVCRGFLIFFPFWFAR